MSTQLQNKPPESTPSPESDEQLAGWESPIPDSEKLNHESDLDKDPDPDRDPPKTLPTAERPLIRSIFAVAIVAFILLIGAGIWTLFQSAGRRTTIQPPEPPSPPEKPAPQSEDLETARLKSKLAFQDQRKELESSSQQPEPAEPEPQPETEPQPEPQPTAQPTPPARKMSVVREVQPQPRPRPQPQPQLTPPQNEPIDPYQRWATLANTSTRIAPQTVQAALIEQTRTILAQTPETRVEKSSSPADESPTNNNPIPKAIIGQTQPQQSTIDHILSRTPINWQRNDTQTVKVELGAIAPATINAPMLWINSNGNRDLPNHGRFTVKLNEPLMAADGTPALPAGTILVAQTSIVDPNSKLTIADAIALIYRNQQGKLIEEKIPPGTIAIRGENGEPLVAEALHDPGGDFFMQDLLLGTLNAAARIGEIANEPRTDVTVTGANGTIVETTTDNDNDLMAAALEGFFDPISDNLENRSQQAIANAAEQSNAAAVLPNGQEVSVIVTGFLEVVP